MYVGLERCSINEILSYVPRPNILELKGVMTKQQVKDYILSLPDGTFDDNCQVLNDENGTAIRYGHSAKNVWSLSMPASFSFTCQAPSQISFKCRYSDTGRSLFQGGYVTNNNGWKTLMFPKAFSNTSYHFLCSCVSNSTYNGEQSANPSNVTPQKDRVEIYSGDNAVGFYWLARGV